MRLRATYRLQLSPEQDFAAVGRLIGYLRELGVSHLYLSPSLQARAGSTHGYDVIDPTRVSEDLGGEQGLRELARQGLGVILDIVPNHMGVDEHNRWWSDPQLRQRFFDVDPETGSHRRFFDIDDLAAVRQEDPEVFEVTHAKVLELVRDGVLDGLRVDHPDGLADPAGYLVRLRDAGAPAVWVEKILHAARPPERLRDWPVEGTVGYEFLNDVCALFVDPAGEATLTALWHELSGDRRRFAQYALEAQLEQARGTFSREVKRLARESAGSGGEAPAPPQFSTEALARGLASLPIYRTYAEPWSGRVEEADREAVEAADMEEKLADALLLRRRAEVPDAFVTRFQQTSPAITAKGIEDTAFYRYLRLLALNEVGGNPDRFGLSVEEFHEANRERARRFPRGLLVTQTHDTKRSGDARARIGALAGMADEWREAVMRWRRLAAPLRSEGAGPDAVEEYLIYQTLVGVWPVEAERLDAYLEKALREAKRNTNWVQQNEAWEVQVKSFARALIAHEPFLDDFGAFMTRAVAEGERSALGQLLLKLTAPGVPDIFQGDELWRLSLVDPDNRRAVDWQERRDALARVKGGREPGVADIKLFFITHSLALRARRPGPFEGAYEPVSAGPAVCAYLRGEAEVLVVVPVRDPRGTVIELPSGASGTWRDVLSERTVELVGDTTLDELGGGYYGLWLLERV